MNSIKITLTSLVALIVVCAVSAANADSIQVRLTGPNAYKSGAITYFSTNIQTSIAADGSTEYSVLESPSKTLETGQGIGKNGHRQITIENATADSATVAIWGTVSDQDTGEIVGIIPFFVITRNQIRPILEGDRTIQIRVRGSVPATFREFAARDTNPKQSFVSIWNLVQSHRVAVSLGLLNETSDENWGAAHDSFRSSIRAVMENGDSLTRSTFLTGIGSVFSNASPRTRVQRYVQILTVLQGGQYSAKGPNGERLSEWIGNELETVLQESYADVQNEINFYLTSLKDDGEYDHCLAFGQRVFSHLLSNAELMDGLSTMPREVPRGIRRIITTTTECIAGKYFEERGNIGGAQLHIEHLSRIGVDFFGFLDQFLKISEALRDQGELNSGQASAREVIRYSTEIELIMEN